jgi:hypothetical protein
VAEFAVQRRPVVTFRNRKPQPHMIDVLEPDDIEAAIERALRPSAALTTALTDYAERIHPYRDGRSSERVISAAVDAIKRGRDGLRNKPFNLVRTLQAWWRVRRDR